MYEHIIIIVLIICIASMCCYCFALLHPPRGLDMTNFLTKTIVSPEWFEHYKHDEV